MCVCTYFFKSSLPTVLFNLLYPNFVTYDYYCGLVHFSMLFGLVFFFTYFKGIILYFIYDWQCASVMICVLNF